MLAGHHALIRSALAAHGGREVDTQGDAFFAVFSSPRGCVAAVLAMQQALQAHAWPGGVRVRMGIHCGEAARTATGLVGLEVHRAARVAAVRCGCHCWVDHAPRSASNADEQCVGKASVVNSRPFPGPGEHTWGPLSGAAARLPPA